VISEIMYDPKGSNGLEFVEISNAGLIEENIGGYRISGDVDYTFPANTVLPVGGYLVVARNPPDCNQRTASPACSDRGPPPTLFRMTKDGPFAKSKRRIAPRGQL
jgi:hypothetical protein